MRTVVLWAFVLLLLYSSVLAVVEGRDGPDAARTYLEDPPEPVLFGHVNTSLSAALLGATALLFAVAMRLETAAGRRPLPGRLFPVSQILLFLFLAADERFRLLPPLARASGIPELGLYGSLAAGELALLLGPGRLMEHPRRALLVGGAGALFAISMGLDFAGGGLWLRRSAEELPKVWSGALLLAFAWLRVEDAVDGLAFPGVHGALVPWGRRAVDRGPAPAPGPKKAGRPLEERTPLNPNPGARPSFVSGSPPEAPLSLTGDVSVHAVRSSELRERQDADLRPDTRSP